MVFHLAGGDPYRKGLTGNCSPMPIGPGQQQSQLEPECHIGSQASEDGSEEPESARGTRRSQEKMCPRRIEAGLTLRHPPSSEGSEATAALILALSHMRIPRITTRFFFSTAHSQSLSHFYLPNNNNRYYWGQECGATAQQQSACLACERPWYGSPAPRDEHDAGWKNPDMWEGQGDQSWEDQLSPGGQTHCFCSVTW